MTNTTRKPHQMKSLSFVLSMVVAAVFAFSLAACGSTSNGSGSAASSTTEQSTTSESSSSASSTSSSTSGTATLQSVLESDASGQKALQNMAQQMADSFSKSSGIDCTTDVVCVGNDITATINASIAKAELGGISVDNAFSGDATVQTMTQAIGAFEQSAGVKGITFTFVLNDSNGETLTSATFNSEGLVK